jgi:hypothetical protein
MKATYNGWKNYATWGVALIIDNERVLWEHALNFANLATEDAKEGEYGTPESRARATLMDSLKDWVEEMVETEAERASDMTKQLLGAGLAEVDWRELAEHYLTAAKENA